MTCKRCGAAVADGAKFCTACGFDLRATATRAAEAPRPEPVVLLVDCPACGSRNAASRVRCGRCEGELDDRGGELLAVPIHGGVRTDEQKPATAQERESARVLIVVTLLAGLAVLAVLFSIVQGRGRDTTTAATAAPEDAERLEVVAVEASSVLPAAAAVTYQPAMLLDGAADTAWNEGAAGPGTGEWVELTLARPVVISRVVLWNGYQKGPAFVENGRVQTLRIDVGPRRFTVGLLDVQGPQAIDLPTPVTAAVIRLTIEAVYAGARYADAAISEVEVYGRDPGR